MPKYNIPVPRPRGIQPSSCESIDISADCVRDMILHVLIGRIADESGHTYELDTIFNPTVNAIDIEIPEQALQSIETIGIGPNLQRYLDWLHPVANGASSNVILGTTRQAVVPSDQVTIVARTVFIEGDGGPTDLISNPQIPSGVDGQFITIIGESDINTVTLEHGSGIHLHGSNVLGAHDAITLMYDGEDNEWIEIGRNNPESEKSWSATSPLGITGSSYSGGFYDFATTHNDFSGSPTFGDATRATAAHFFIVLGQDAVDDLTIRVTGNSIDDDGIGVIGDSFDIVVPSGTIADSYFETPNKWNAVVTISIVSGTARDCNYGWCKYWDNNNNDFRVIGLEATWTGGATDTSPNLLLRHHRAIDWTYNAGAAPTPPSAIADMNADHGTDIRIVNGESGAWKRANLNATVAGGDGEGIIIESVISSQGAFQNANFMVRVRPN